MSKVVVVYGAAGHGKTMLLSLLNRSDVHNVTKNLAAPILSQVLEVLKNLKSGETLVIDECRQEILDVIKGTSYDGFVIVALMA